MNYFTVIAISLVWQRLHEATGSCEMTSSALEKKLGEVTGEVAGALQGKPNSDLNFLPCRSHMLGVRLFSPSRQASPLTRTWLTMRHNQELEASIQNAKRDNLRIWEGLLKSDRAEAADRYEIWHEYVIAAVPAIVIFLQKPITASVYHRKATVAGATISDVDLRLAIEEWESDAISAVRSAYHKADAIFGRKL